MDGEGFRSKMSDLALGTAMAAAARDYQKELLANEKAQSSARHEDIDLDELMDDPELEKLHADRIASLKKEAEKRQALEKKGHGEYREVAEADFLNEVTGSQLVICHFYHREFIRCKIVDKHLKSLAPKYFETKFIKVDAENAPFFVTKMAIKMLPCVVLFRDGVSFERLVGFEELGATDDFPTNKLEGWLLRKGVLKAKKASEDEGYDGETKRKVRASNYGDSDSD